MEKTSIQKRVWSVLLLGFFIVIIAFCTDYISKAKFMSTTIGEEVTYRFILIDQNDKITGYTYFPFREVPLFHQRKNIEKYEINASVHHPYNFVEPDLVSFYDLTLTDHVVSKSELSTKVGDVNLPEGFSPMNPLEK